MYHEPLPKNATLGSSVTFACNVSGNTAISWLVDGTSHHEVTVTERGISSEDYYSEASDSTSSILTVNCNEQNNNTLLQCVGYSGGQFAKSRKVLLRIQGHYLLSFFIAACVPHFLFSDNRSLCLCSYNVNRELQHVYTSTLPSFFSIYLMCILIQSCV